MARPTVMTDSTVKKLLYAFSNSFSDEEACCYAWISKQTLYNYWDKNPEFLDRKEVLKNKPSIKAKLNLVKAVENWNLSISKYWLEKKSWEEFWAQVSVASKWWKNPYENKITPEEQRQVNEILERELRCKKCDN